VFNVSFKPLPEKRPTFVRRLFRDVIKNVKQKMEASPKGKICTTITPIQNTVFNRRRGITAEITTAFIFVFTRRHVQDILQRDESCRRRETSRPGAHGKEHQASSTPSHWVNSSIELNFGSSSSSEQSFKSTPTYWAISSNEVCYVIS
jgi:hypothetical protein